MDIFTKIKAHQERNQPLVAFRYPTHTQNTNYLIKVYLQKNTKLYTVKDFQESGFLLAPFLEEQNPILFPCSACEIVQEQVSKATLPDHQQKATIKDESPTTKEEHLRRIQKALEKIEDNTFKKVVLSRKIDFPSPLSPLTLFKRLLKQYPTAFVYLWHHPDVGTWLGASPEVLLKLNGLKLQTMALASTQPVEDHKLPQWTSKEIKEQAFVSDFIKKQLAPYTSTLQIGQTENAKAGKLWHLKSKISGRIKNRNALKNILHSIHPTPAVCGIPKKETQKFIVQNENYNREYYSGFLGELNLQELHTPRKTALFVNLRCMQANDPFYRIYVGGGIVKGSVPEKEWQETINKSKTMLDVLG